MGLVVGLKVDDCRHVPGLASRADGRGLGGRWYVLWGLLSRMPLPLPLPLLVILYYLDGLAEQHHHSTVKMT